MPTTTHLVASLASCSQRPIINTGSASRAGFTSSVAPRFLHSPSSHGNLVRDQRRTISRVQAVGEAPGSGLQPELRSAIEAFVEENKVVLFMKGTKEMPMCGFSNTTVQILNSMNVPYVTVNILEDDLLRSGMKEFSQWPTFPQIYIGGEFYGGCDILIASYQNGELAESLEAALNS
ncbi:hypothetical protein Ndes2526B_g02110 [Nannochloris sp. 'desiccata']